MLLPLLWVLVPPAPVYNGRAGQLAVEIPRVNAEVPIDGTLDAPAWDQAARLTGFSQFLPIDGVPAADSTTVLVFTTKKAIYFGIRAYEAHGPVHATVADRDNISADDYVQIYLDTSHDHRTAYVFGVNPLGIQADGILSEGLQTKGGGFGARADTRDTVDLSTDYTWRSRGHVTDVGYEVEIAIPFASIRFASGEQHWRLNILRQVQHSRYVDTWAPARLANASFLAQSGTLGGLTDLARGVVLDVNPELTSQVDGGPAPNGWRYGVQPLHPGGNIRWGPTDNLTVDGTVRPDFSQVESDVPQIMFDPRQALFFPEKRPFFLDGLEQFDTPNALVDTRRVVQPNGALKLTGELGGASLGVLSAIDTDSASLTGRDDPVMNVIRAQRQLGATTVGVLGTDREVGARFNHVGGLDGRAVFGHVYDLRWQGVMSATHSDSVHGVGGFWDALFERNGHRLRLSYEITGIDPHFVDQSGFVARAGIVNLVLDNAIVFYGKAGGLFESYTFDFAQNTTWVYDAFFALHRGEDVRWHFSNAVNLRGGWVFNGNVFIETYGYDPTLYQNDYIAKKTATGIDTVPYAAGRTTGNLPNLDIVTGFGTPRWKGFDMTLQTVTGFDDNYYEWSSAWLFNANATLNWRPNERAHISLIYAQNQLVRRSNDTQVYVQRVPYLEVAYQLSRPISVRLIGQYNSAWQAALRDDGRTNDPILIRDPATGALAPAAQYVSNDVSASVLFSYQPTPGTVVFLGYGGGYTEPWAFNFTGLTRTSDHFFIKVSYLLHLGSA
jgi:Domain of unknown function (DUF5916)